MIRSILTVALLIPSLAPATMAQDLLPPEVMVAHHDAALTVELSALLRSRGAAIVAGDANLLPPMAEDFIGTGFNGAVVDLPTWIEIHFGPKPGFERFEASEISGWQIGPGVAVAIGRLDVRTNGGFPVNTRNRFTAIFRMTEGTWQESVYHETGVPIDD